MKPYLGGESEDFSQALTLRVGSKILSLDRPLLMGTLNITPDSFYAASRISIPDEILNRVRTMREEGMDILDLGAMSSRPGAEMICEAEETDRLLPVLEAIRKNNPDLIISIDSFRSNVIKQAARVGIEIANDISAGMLDPMMPPTVKALNLTYILMHMPGNPLTMQKHTHYHHLRQDILQYLQQKVAEMRSLCITDLIIDPGIGFGKTTAQNFELIKHLSDFKLMGVPLLIGISRKSFIWKTLKGNSESALNGTSFMHAYCLQNGANILRVHDVHSAMECIKLHQEIKKY